MSLPRVEVEWRDSMGQGGWQQRDELGRDVEKDGYLNCQSCGYLFREREDSVTLVLSDNAAGQVGEALTIPREAIVAIHPLRRG